MYTATGVESGVTMGLTPFVLAALVSLVSGQGHIELTLSQRSEVHTTECLTYTYFKVTADEARACDDLYIQVEKLDGEPNLYVARAPNIYPKYKSLAWGSYNWGSEELTIGSWDSAYEPGADFYIGVHAYCGEDVNTNHTAAVYTVLVEHRRHSGQHPHSEDDLYNALEVSGSLPAEGYRYHRFCVPTQCVNVTVRLRHCSSPTEDGCDGRYGFPELLVTHSIMYMTVNDLTWMLGDWQRTVNLSPADPNFGPGHYYIGVYGWCTPVEHCPDRDTCGPCDLAENLNYYVKVTSVSLSQKHCDELMQERPSTGGQGKMMSSLRDVGILLAITRLLRLWAL